MNKKETFNSGTKVHDCMDIESRMCRKRDLCSNNEGQIGYKQGTGSPEQIVGRAGREGVMVASFTNINVLLKI
ncbi:MAG: hypothetical protein LBJ63_03170 [Prevotellaceae bacterium]|jgi:hypothetical protein|nr:hypothetical protein [Prevotellaceae bacterium]